MRLPKVRKSLPTRDLSSVVRASASARRTMVNLMNIRYDAAPSSSEAAARIRSRSQASNAASIGSTSGLPPEAE